MLRLAAQKTPYCVRDRNSPEDREIASIARHFQKGPIPTHTEHQIIASNAREFAPVEAIVGDPHDLEGPLSAARVRWFSSGCTHGLDDRLAVSLQ